MRSVLQNLLFVIGMICFFTACVSSDHDFQVLLNDEYGKPLAKQDVAVVLPAYEQFVELNIGEAKDVQLLQTDENGMLDVKLRTNAVYIITTENPSLRGRLQPRTDLKRLLKAGWPIVVLMRPYPRHIKQIDRE